MASIINFDADLYSSTICALNFAKPVIDKHTILIFDEFIMNKNWEQDEYKALEEFCANNHYTYEVLAISFFTKQVAVKLIGIWIEGISLKVSWTEKNKKIKSWENIMKSGCSLWGEDMNLWPTGYGPIPYTSMIYRQGD